MRSTLLWVAFTGCLAATTALAQPAALRARQLAREASAEALERDPIARVALFAQAVDLMPEHPRYRLALAAAQVAAGEHAPAVRTLEGLVQLGNHADLINMEPFAALRGRGDFDAVCAAMARLREPVGRGEVAFTLTECAGLIEGIAWERKTGAVFLGDVHQRAVWRRDADGRVSRFDCGDERVLGVFGLEVDEKRGLLWVATSAWPDMQGYSPEMKGRAGVAAFDLNTGAVRQIVFAGPDTEEHVIGDLLVAPDGTVFATDSAAPVLWRLPEGGEALERWVEHEEFLSLQGLALAADGSALIVAAYGNGLLRVDGSTREVERLPAPAGATLLGVDGLECAADGSFLAVQNGLAPPRVVRIELDLPARFVRTVTVLEAAHEALADPTLICRGGEGMLVVGDAGWRLFEASADTAAPSRAVPIVRVRVPAR